MQRSLCSLLATEGPNKLRKQQQRKLNEADCSRANGNGPEHGVGFVFQSVWVGVKHESEDLLRSRQQIVSAARNRDTEREMIPARSARSERRFAPTRYLRNGVRNPLKYRTTKQKYD